MPDEIIYLDHAAATPVDERVFTAMAPYFSQKFYNPSSPYLPALGVRRDYEAAKHRIAAVIGGKADELIITAGATESINLAFSAVRGHVVTAAIEHHAVLAAACRHDCTLVEPTPKGIITPESIRAAVRPETTLVSIALANNELGTLQPLRDIASVLHAERARRLAAGDRTPLYLHTDASQGVGQVDVHAARLGVDMMTINAGKVYGPKQVGALWVARYVQLQPQIVGGGQERGLRSGTENVAGAVGFALAMEISAKHQRTEQARLSKLRDAMQHRLAAQFPQMVVSGHSKRRLAGHLHVSFPGIDAERLIFRLESRGVLLATGSACAANKGTRSHVLTAIGLAPTIADGSLRITLGRLSTVENTERALQILCEEIAAEYQRTGA